MTAGERFTLGTVAIAVGVVLLRTSNDDSLFSIIGTSLHWAVLLVMGLVMMVSSGKAERK
jgi:hypothetical protein